jgi:hypothetical protein
VFEYQHRCSRDVAVHRTKISFARNPEVLNEKGLCHEEYILFIIIFLINMMRSDKRLVLCAIVAYRACIILNPYPANVENMVSS